MPLFGFGLLLAANLVVAPESFPLRSGCGTDELVVATLKSGDPVNVRFALSGGDGTCYKVSVESAGKTYDGYLPASAVLGAEQFDQLRRAAKGVGVSASVAPPQVNLAAANSEIRRASELVNANQPEEALLLLEPLVKANRRDAGLLALAGYAAFQSDRTREAIHYLEESLALTPDPSITQLLASARREAVSDRSSEKLVGVRFTMRYEPGAITAEQARQLSPLLDTELSRISQELGCRTEERMTAVIQSREAYLKTTGAAEWSSGAYDGRIRVAVMETQVGPQTRKAVTHEIVHACLARIGNWPAWLHEGLAQKLSGEQISPAQDIILEKQLDSGQVPPLIQMGNSYASLGSEQAAAAYGVSLKAVDSLYRTYGSDGVRSLLRSPERLEQVSVEIDRKIRARIREF
jgi:tetratricopeptide (TPR) repeat protein